MTMKPSHAIMSLARNDIEAMQTTSVNIKNPAYPLKADSQELD
ncbi:hypothetical protein [Rickettsia asembonensis]|nr:hypothetical protein [Rickettsia asembonensis]